MRTWRIGLAGVIGLLMMDMPASSSAAPRPELIGYAAIHPVCVASGPGIAEGLADRFCAAVAAVLRQRGHAPVEPARIADGRLGAPRHIVLGFTLSAAAGRLAIAGLLSRIDRPSGALLPPPAEILPLPGGAAPDEAALAAAAARLLGAMGF